MPEYKMAPQYVKAVKDREVTGIFSVFGNVDAGSDRIWSGAFTDSIMSSGPNILHLWQHNSDEPPIAVVKGLREVGRAELPPQIRNLYPEATGGAEVSREYLPTPRGDEVLSAIKAGSPLQMSFAYQIKDQARTQENGKTVRELYKLGLLETSDVTFGMNPATMARSKAGLSVGAVAADYLARLQMILTDARAIATDDKALAQMRQAKGRLLSKANRDQLADLRLSLQMIIDDLDGLIDVEEPTSAAGKAAAQQLYAEFQRNVARLNGVQV